MGMDVSVGFDESNPYDVWFASFRFTFAQYDIKPT